MFDGTKMVNYNSLYFNHPEYKPTKELDETWKQFKKRKKSYNNMIHDLYVEELSKEYNNLNIKIIDAIVRKDYYVNDCYSCFIHDYLKIIDEYVGEVKNDTIEKIAKD